MTRVLKLRLAAALLLASLPPAALLVVLAAAGHVGWVWILVAIVPGVAGCALTVGVVRQALARRAEMLETVSRALETGSPVAHLLSALDHPASSARLFAAADRVLSESDTLAEQRDEFEAILRSMREAVVVTGRRGELVMLNQAAREIFGLSPEAVYAGRDLIELSREPGVQEFVARSAAAQEAEVSTAELVIQKPATRHLRVTSAPVRASRGGRAARVLVFTDVTQLKAYENMRADFVANLTHEMRTPLSALRGYAETLLRGVEDSDTQRRFLGIIERQSRRLARLIDDLLSLSDLERGLTALNPEPLEPRRLLEEATELMREQARRKEIALDIECAPDLPKLTGDRDRLHQVLVNLIDNAIKYTPRGGKITAIARTAAAQAGNGKLGVELLVVDTGEGIAAADIPRLTERFYRVDRARSRELGGTGLGLAIVKHIVQLHHGKLGIESRPSEGTTVTVRIPVAEA